VHQVRAALASPRPCSMAGDALRDIHGLTPCRSILVDDLLVIRAYLVNQACLVYGGGLCTRGASTTLLGRRQSFAKIIDDFVELVVRDLRSPADHVGDNAAPLFPRHPPSRKHLDRMTPRADALHGFAVRPIG
jgi:hypothetical protein